MPRDSVGFTVLPPTVGQPLVIEMHGRRGVRITSPVTRVIPKTDGLLVLTTRSRYMIATSGDAYLVTDTR